MNTALSDDPALSLWSSLLAEAGRLGPGRTFLDIGGGSGVLTVAVAERCGAAGVLADPDTAPSFGILTVRARAEELPFPSALFHAAMFSHVLHHLPNPQAAIVEAARVLAPDGCLLIRTATHADLLALPHARWIPHLLDGVLASVPDFPSISGWLRAAGLTIVEQRTVETPQAMTLAAYAETVAMQAWRNWAMAPVGGPDPRDVARAWAMETFEKTPPVRETLLACRRP